MEDELRTQTTAAETGGHWLNPRADLVVLNRGSARQDIRPDMQRISSADGDSPLVFLTELSVN